MTRTLVLSLALLGCAKDKAPDAKPAADLPVAAAPTAQPAAVGADEPATASPPEGTAGKPQVALGTGETLATPSDEASKVTLDWQTPGGPIALAVVVRGDEVVVRGSTGAETFDIGEPVASGSLGQALEVIGDKVLFTSKDMVGRAAEAGAVLAYEARQLEMVDGKPKVTSSWSCDESTAKGGTCKPPTWAEPPR